MDRVYRVTSAGSSARPFTPTRGGHPAILDDDGRVQVVPRISGGADEVYRVEIPVTVDDRTEPAMSNIRRKVSGFEGALARTERRLKSWGTSISNTGRSMTRYFTMPIIGAGAAILKMYGDFEKSMTDIRALVGASGRQMSQYRDTVLKMARDFPQGPQALAEALYFVTSSGFSGAKALDILRQSAKAAAAGLGETVEVADAVTSAVNAYGSSQLKASRATDILLATVREGKAEPTELAGAIGRVIAPAESLGVAFDEVGAAIAGLSLTGLDAAEAVTALRGILSTFMKPTLGAKKALKDMGYTVKEVEGMLREDFFSTILTLRKDLERHGIMPAEIFGNVRALNGFLALTGRNAEKNQRIFRELAGAVGDTDRAFDKASKDPMFRFNRALSNLRTTAIEVAPTILPVAEKIVRLLGQWAKAIGRMDEEKLMRIVKALGVLLVAGPAMRLLGGGMRLAGGAMGLGRMAIYGGAGLGLAGGGGGLGGGVAGAGGRALPPGMSRGLFGLRRGRVALPAGPRGLAGQTYGALGTTLGRAPGQTGRFRSGLGKFGRMAGAAARGSAIAAMLAPFAAGGARALGRKVFGVDDIEKQNEVWDTTEKNAIKLSRALLTKGAPAIQKFREEQAALIDQMGSDEEKYQGTQEMLDAISRGHNKAAIAIMQQTHKHGGMNKVLTKQERKWFDTAVAANEFALAQKIVSRAIERTRKDTEKNGEEAKETARQYHDLKWYMERLPKSIKSRIDLIATYGDLEKAARAFMRMDQWAGTVNETLRRGSGTGKLPSSGGGGGGGGGGRNRTQKHDYPHTMRLRGPGVAQFAIGNIEEDVTFAPRGAGRGGGGGGGVSVTIAEGAIQINGAGDVTPEFADRLAHKLAQDLEEVLSNMTGDEDVA